MGAHRIPILDGYRACSILFVLAAHLLPLGPKSWHLNGAVAALGMTMFFSLSGFLIAGQLLQNQNVGRFLLRRVARIWPLVILYTFVVYIALHFDPTKMVLTNLFVVNYANQYLDGWNGHLWSLCVEMQFYLAIAFAVAIAGRAAIWIVWPACLFVTALRILSGAEINILTHLRVDEILTGACLATVSGRFTYLRFSPLALAAAFLATLTTSWPEAGYFQYARPYATAILFVTATCQSSDSLTARLLSSKPARYIADISYALYVIHPAFTHGWLEGYDTFDKYAIKRPISIALTFALATLSTFYWEKPCTKLARSLSIRTVAAPSG